MTQLATPLEELNLNSADLFEQGKAHEVFQYLRQHRPVHWNREGSRNVGFWNITKYEDVMFISRNPQLFISSKDIGSGYPKDESLIDPETDDRGKHLIKMDPPRHVRVRRLVNKGFTPRAVKAMEPHIRDITNQILDDISEKGRTDFVLDVASKLPLAVICEMMGVKKADWPYMFQLTNKVLGAADREYQTDVPEEIRGTPEGAQMTARQGMKEMRAYFAEQLEARKAKRDEDLLSLLVDSEDQGETLTDDEILWFAFLLIVAGNETTRNAISGGLQVLCENPDQRRKLQTDMSLMPGAVEEILRWVSPVMHMARVATEDVEIRGTQIRKGERVVMWYPSVNRDEDVFAEPYTFDIQREPNDHLAFGIGEHFCLGAGFARMELQVMFEELFRRFPDIEMDGEAERLRSNFIGGIKHLPVRFTPESKQERSTA
jgi:cytochrome P450